jgi:hypothetical protein
MMKLLTGIIASAIIIWLRGLWRKSRKAEAEAWKRQRELLKK